MYAPPKRQCFSDPGDPCGFPGAIASLRRHNRCGGAYMAAVLIPINASLSTHAAPVV